MKRQYAIYLSQLKTRGCCLGEFITRGRKIMTPLADAIKYNLKLAPLPKRTTKGTIVLKMDICRWEGYIKTKTLDKAICEILKTTKSSAADISNKYGYDRDRVNKRLYSLSKRGLVIKTHLQDGSIQWASTNINQEA